MSRLQGWRVSGGKIAVAGMGKSGVAAARLLHRQGLSVYLFDDGTDERLQATAEEMRREFGSRSFDVQVGGHDPARIATSEALILSPGIPPTGPMVRAAENAGIPVIAEAQLGLDAMPSVPYVAITGTNGKTTTTAMADHLFRAAGRLSVAAGNIGTAVCEVALWPKPPEWMALELSSFQLHDMPDVRPTVGVLTNLAPDHLDRYPSVEAYYADKARLFANATARSIWVGNLDDAGSRRMLHDVHGRHLAFTVAPDRRADAWFDHEHQALMLAGHHLLARHDLHLLGDHNVANALAASLALHAVGVRPDEIAEGLRSFRALTHRLEPVGEVDGILWINDSKATNVASTEVAVRGMTRPFVLLLGGRHKGEPYTGLIPHLRAHCVAVIAYGEAGDRIEADLKDAVRVVRGGSFDDVVAKARDLAPEGGAVLLSPACSSFDMFTGYDARGAAFRALVERM